MSTRPLGEFLALPLTEVRREIRSLEPKLSELIRHGRPVIGQAHRLGYLQGIRDERLRAEVTHRQEDARRLK